jgi:hypothetical protein
MARPEVFIDENRGGAGVSPRKRHQKKVRQLAKRVTPWRATTNCSDDQQVTAEEAYRLIDYFQA